MDRGGAGMQKLDALSGSRKTRNWKKTETYASKNWSIKSTAKLLFSCGVQRTPSRAVEDRRGQSIFASTHTHAHTDSTNGEKKFWRGVCVSQWWTKNIPRAIKMTTVTKWRQEIHITKANGRTDRQTERQRDRQTSKDSGTDIHTLVQIKPI